MTKICFASPAIIHAPGNACSVIAWLNIEDNAILLEYYNEYEVHHIHIINEEAAAVTYLSPSGLTADVIALNRVLNISSLVVDRLEMEQMSLQQRLEKHKALEKSLGLERSKELDKGL